MKTKSLCPNFRLCSEENYWRREDYEQEFHQPLLVHQRCMSARRSLDERYELSMELSTYLAFLVQKLGLSGAKWARALDRADLSSTIEKRSQRGFRNVRH